MFRVLLSPILLAIFWLQTPSVPQPVQANESAAPAQADKDAAAKPNERATHIGGSVKPPKLIHSVDPEYTPEARKKKFNGNVQVYLWVEENGMPSHVRVVKGVGMGLDEKAVQAVSQFRFKPAMQDGKPVKVDLYIDVNFQLF
jgi:TonB family protein